MEDPRRIWFTARNRTIYISLRAFCCFTTKKPLTRYQITPGPPATEVEGYLNVCIRLPPLTTATVRSEFRHGDVLARSCIGPAVRGETSDILVHTDTIGFHFH